MRAFIGIGPGRCGTQSLARIVGACHNTYVSHEAFPSEWYENSPNIGKLILAFKQGIHPNWPDAAPGGLVGEVSCNLLPKIQAIRDPLPDLGIVCLHRPKAEVVESFLRWLKRYSLRPCDRLFNNPDRLNARLPIIDAATAAQSWGFYWEMAEEIMRMVKPPVLHMHTKSLNDDFSVKNLFDFLDMPMCDRVLTDRRKWNSSKEPLWQTPSCKARVPLRS